MKTFILFTLLSGFSFFIPTEDIRKISWKNFQGENIEDIYGIGSKTYHYESEKLTRLEFRDKEGKLISEEKFSSFYPAIFKYSYDPQGNYISREAYNKAGELMDLDGYYDSSILRFSYNAKNQLIERLTLDKSGKLLEMGDSKIARISYEYDEKGRIISIKNFNAAGNILPGKANFSYLPDGKAGKITYWGKSEKISSEITFSYSDQGLVQGYSQIYPDEEDELIVQFAYVDSILTGLSIRSKKSDFEKIEKRGVKVDFDGWYLDDSLLLKTKFQHPGEGKFKLSLNPDGTVQDLEPIRVKAPKEFEQEVYELFRNLRFKRHKEIDSPTLTGTVHISILESFSGFDLLEFLRKPKPND